MDDTLTKSNERNVAVFLGDENFPRRGRGRSLKRFVDAVTNVARVLGDLKLNHVYIPTYKGTNFIAGSVLKKLNIPYTVIVPHPNFGGVITSKDKKDVATISAAADKTVIFGFRDDDEKVDFETEEATYDLVEYITERCNAVIIAEGEKPSQRFTNLLSKFPDDAFEKLFRFDY